MTAEPTTYERKTTETVQAMQFDGTAESAGRIWDWVNNETAYIARLSESFGDVKLDVDNARMRPGYYVVLRDGHLTVWTQEAFEEGYRKPTQRYATGGYINPKVNLTDAILGRR